MSPWVASSVPLCASAPSGPTLCIPSRSSMLGPHVRRGVRRCGPSCPPCCLAGRTDRCRLPQISSGNAWRGWRAAGGPGWHRARPHQLNGHLLARLNVGAQVDIAEAAATNLAAQPVPGPESARGGIAEAREAAPGSRPLYATSRDRSWHPAASGGLSSAGRARELAGLPNAPLTPTGQLRTGQLCGCPAPWAAAGEKDLDAAPRCPH